MFNKRNINKIFFLLVMIIAVTSIGTVKVEASKQKEKLPYTEKELRLLACLVYAEAGGETYRGKFAVANVVMNRLNSESYSHVNTIKEVIYDKKWAVQFAVIKKDKSGTSPLDRAFALYDTGKYSGRNNKIENEAMKECIKAAKSALGGKSIIDYLSFNALNSSASRIKKSYPGYRVIGNQIFYKVK